MKKLLIILILLTLNTAFALADISVTVDGKPILMKPIETSGNTFLSKQILEDNTIGGLQDKEIIYQGANYDIRDSITIGLEEDSNKGYKLSVGYYYIFDETIDLAKASFDSPLEIELLGEPYKITKVNSGTGFTVCNDCDSYPLDVGDSVEVGGKRVTLENVGGGGSIIVDVDGIKETISSTVETVNGVEILPIATQYAYYKAERSATLIIGEDIFRDVTAGDTFDGDSDWKWDIKSLNEKSATTLTLDKLSGPYIGIKNNPVWGNIDSEECITIPNNYPKVCIKPCEEDCLECETNTDCITLGKCDPIVDTYVLRSCFCENAKCHHINYCEANSDCVQVQNDICGCKSISINKDYYEEWSTDLEYKIKTKSCSSPCAFEEYIPVCTDGMCGFGVTGGIPEFPSIYGFLDYIVEYGEGYVLVLGDKAPSTDSLAATDIASGIRKYSSGKTVIEAKLASEVTNEDKKILLGHPCDNPLIDLSCKNWPYKQGETLIKVDGNNLIIAGTTSEDTRSTAKLIADYQNYPFLKESDTILVTETGLEIPEITAESRQENEEIEEEEIIEENVSGKVQENTSETIQEGSAKLMEEPVEKKKGWYVPFTKRIWEWILNWFR